MREKALLHEKENCMILYRTEGRENETHENGRKKVEFIVEGCDVFRGMNVHAACCCVDKDVFCRLGVAA